MKVLRDLPGVQRVTDLTRNPRNFEYPQTATTMQEIEAVAVSLFGVCHWGLTWIDEPDDDPSERDEWEGTFSVTLLPWPESRPFWEALGWDISDGRGGELISAHWFMRPIIAVEGGLDEDARYTPDGSGVTTTDCDDDRGGALEDRLQAEASAFLSRRR